MRKLIRSSAFGLDEHMNTYEWIKTTSCTKERCGVAITKAQRKNYVHKQMVTLRRDYALYCELHGIESNFKEEDFPGALNIPPMVQLARKLLEDRKEEDVLKEELEEHMKNNQYMGDSERLSKATADLFSHLDE